MEWHTLSAKEAAEKLITSENGLTNEEVLKRRAKYGPNELTQKKSFNAIKIIAEQCSSVLILILIFAAILSALIGALIDTTVILAIIILNITLGFTQEYKAEKAIQALKKMMIPKTMVMRNGYRQTIDSRDLVPGDIIILNEGDRVTVDARIIESRGLKINEAALTGESIPEEKTTIKLLRTVSLADRTNIAYLGTTVVSGSGKAIVFNTGMNTELGKISDLVQEIKPEKNPFKEKLDQFAKKIGFFVIILSMLIVALMLATGFEIFHSFLIAVSLAVSAIPEGLPAVISLGLAFATTRMLKQNVLIRKLPASETLGRTTVVCTDKTGTLTEEKMKVTDIYANRERNPKKHKNLLLEIGVLCNNATLEKNEKGEAYTLGDPTEIALLHAGKENFIDKKEREKAEPFVQEFPFSSERKMMSVIRKKERYYRAYIKGAPESIIARAKYELKDGKKILLEKEGKKELYEAYDALAKKGLRVLACAYKDIPSYAEYTQQMIEDDTVFVGLQGMIDPPRKEVKTAIAQCKEAGIKVIMITGDARLTAEAVARQIGLEGKSIDSEQLTKMTEKELQKALKDTVVFSRIFPKDKLRIIDALKKQKEIVAMTGDGVNDALALKRADIGIAMGVRGTEVARESAEIVLLDDNFASIVNGITEGRRIHDNMRKFITFLLSVNFTEVVLLLTVLLIWRDPSLLPFLPLQILWINLVTDSFPAMALTLEPSEKNIMKRKPTNRNLLEGAKKFILLVSMIAVGICLIFFYLYIDDIEKAQTMVVTSSIMFEVFFVFSCKSSQPITKTPFNKYLLYAVGFSTLIHLVALYTPLNRVFGFVPISFLEFSSIIGLCIGGFIIIELLKSKVWKP